MNSAIIEADLVASLFGGFFPSEESSPLNESDSLQELTMEKDSRTVNIVPPLRRTNAFTENLTEEDLEQEFTINRPEAPLQRAQTPVSSLPQFTVAPSPVSTPRDSVHSLISNEEKSEPKEENDPRSNSSRFSTVSMGMPPPVADLVRITAPAETRRTLTRGQSLRMLSFGVLSGLIAGMTVTEETGNLSAGLLMGFGVALLGLPIEMLVEVGLRNLWQSTRGSAPILPMHVSGPSS